MTIAPDEPDIADLDFEPESAPLAIYGPVATAIKEQLAENLLAESTGVFAAFDGGDLCLPEGVHGALVFTIEGTGPASQPPPGGEISEIFTEAIQDYNDRHDWRTATPSYGYRNPTRTIGERVIPRLTAEDLYEAVRYEDRILPASQQFPFDHFFPHGSGAYCYCSPSRRDFFEVYRRGVEASRGPGPSPLIFDEAGLI